MLGDSELQAAALCSGLDAVQEPGVKCGMRQLQRQVRRGCVRARALGRRAAARLAPGAPHDRQSLRSDSMCPDLIILLMVRIAPGHVQAELGKAVCGFLLGPCVR